MVAGGDSQEAGGGQDARTVGTKERQTGGTLGRCGGAGGDEGAEFRRRERGWRGLGMIGARRDGGCGEGGRGRMCVCLLSRAGAVWRTGGVLLGVLTKYKFPLLHQG